MHDKFRHNVHVNLKKAVPVKGALELTYRCNLRCKHCYSMVDSPMPEMNRDSIIYLLDELKKAGCLWLLITGGEPLIRNDFLDIYTYAKKQGFLVTVFTNATLINTKLIKAFSMHRPFMIEVSMYGFSEYTYNLVTGRKESFNDTLRGIKLLKLYNIPFKIKMPVLNINKDDLGKVKVFADNLKVAFRYDAIIYPRLNGDISPYRYSVSPEEIKALDSGYRNFEAIKCGTERNKLFPKKKRYIYFTCGAGMNFFSIDPYGKLKLCMLSGYPGYNVLKNSFGEGWKKYFLRNNIFILNKHRQKKKKCINCDIITSCNICPGWWKDKGGKDMFLPVDYLCRVAKLRTNK